MSQPDTEEPVIIEYYSVAKVAQMLEVTTETVRRWILEGHLKAFRVGARGRYRIARRDYAAFANERFPTT